MNNIEVTICGVVLITFLGSLGFFALYIIKKFDKKRKSYDKNIYNYNRFTSQICASGIEADSGFAMTKAVKKLQESNKYNNSP